MTTLDFIQAMEAQIAMWSHVMDTEPDMAAAAMDMARAAIAKAKESERDRWMRGMAECTKLEPSTPKRRS